MAVSFGKQKERAEALARSTTTSTIAGDDLLGALELSPAMVSPRLHGGEDLQV
jgi:hypothetical protein